MRIGSEQGLEFEELLICEMYFLVILEFCGQFAKSDEVKMLICLFVFGENPVPGTRE